LGSKQHLRDNKYGRLEGDDNLDFNPRFSYLQQVNLAHRRDVTGDGRLTERVRFLRAGLVTPLPGGLGIEPAGTMTGARGASL
jgi:hypothetical protein